MMEDLLYKLGVKKKKSRSEKVKDAFSETIHTIADSLDEMVADSRKEAPKVVERVQNVAKQVREEAPKKATAAQEQAQRMSAEATHLAGEMRDQATEVLTPKATAASKKAAAAVTALGALTADWDEIARSLSKELTERIPPEELEQAAGKSKQIVGEAVSKKERAFGNIGAWLLRVAVGLWFLENLRGKDLAAYIDYGAGDRLQAASREHPIAWYKELLDETLIPNASLLGVAEILGSLMVALGYITGLNRRFASLLGVIISGNNLLADYQDHDERGQNILVLLTQVLLLRAD